MVISPKDAITGIGATEKVVSSLYKLITGNRGFKRTVAIELKENLELIRLYIVSGSETKDLIPQITDTAFRNALAEGFNFNSLNRSKIGSKSTKHVPQLQKYNGWETQRLFENVYQKVATIKHALNIKNSRKEINIDIRLRNIFKLMVVLAIHIGS